VGVTHHQQDPSETALRVKQALGHISSAAWIGTSWIVEVTAGGTRDGKPFQATHL
jgi:hypothetical protein